MRQKLMATEQDRNLLLDAFARGLESDECIIQVIDTYRASGRVTVQVPLDDTAEVLVTEPPRLQPGGITELISYVRVQDPMVRDVTFRSDGTTERDREFPLRPVRTPL